MLSASQWFPHQLKLALRSPTPMPGYLWFVLSLFPMIWLQRQLHREIQAVLLLITRHPGLTIGLFSLLFLPGVLLHELSHLVAARLLGVRTARFSLLPQALADGRLLLGYVETRRTDVLRDSLIGLAPLMTGSAFLAYVALDRLNLPLLWHTLQNRQIDLFLAALWALPTVSDFPLWLYLTFAVSSTMLPSASDRHAWPPLLLWMSVLLALAIVAGLGPWLLAHLAPLLNRFLQSVAMLFGLSAILHLLVLMPVFLLHRLLAQLFHLDVN